MNEINENQDGLFIFVSIVGIVLFVALLVHAFDKHKKKDSVGMLIALFFAFLALLIVIGSNYAIDDPSKRLVKFNLDFNSNEFKETVVCYWGYGKVVVIVITIYYIERFISLYRLSKNTYKMFKSYVAIINKHFIKGKPIKDHRVKAFVVDNDMVNPLEPELWNKNAAIYFTERII